MEGNIVNNWRRLSGYARLFLLLIPALVLQGCFLDDDDGGGADTLNFEPFSSTIALSGNGGLLGVVNNAHTVTFFRVEDRTKISEVAVGNDASHIAFHPNNKKAYITNAADSTVSVIELSTMREIAKIPTGEEPRGIVISPNGTAGYVVNFSGKSVTQFDPSSDTVVRTIVLDKHAEEIVMTNDGDLEDGDEKVFVAMFYAETITGGDKPQTQENQGLFAFFNAVTGATPTFGTIAPIADAGFTVDRAPFCIANGAVNDTYCEGADPAFDEGAFPNQLGSGRICGNKWFIPTIGASPEPPVDFNTNIQALLVAVDVPTMAEDAALKVNINEEVAAEAAPAKADVSGTEDLQRVFMGDFTSFVPFGPDCAEAIALSRSNDYLMFGTLGAGPFTINPPNPVRVQVGHIPTGIATNGSHAFVNNMIDGTVSVVNLANKVVEATLEAKTLPAPGSSEHKIRLGKWAFMTGLGIPADGIFDDDIRAIDNERNRASADGWSSCASCHPRGNLADGNTWIFATGPRQTIPLDGTAFSDSNHRITNWNAVRSSMTEFNNNSRNVQGGEGFVDDFDAAGEIPAPDPVIFNHGITQGASDAWDAMTQWMVDLRPVNVPQGDAATIAAGRTVFIANCASCHGGPKWTSSQRDLYKNNPTFNGNPLAGGTVIDPTLTVAGAQIISKVDANDGGNTIDFINDVNTRDPAGDFEINQAGAASLGGIGFNNPSLLSTFVHAPYSHDGQDATLADVFARHELPGGGTIDANLTAQELADVTVFVNSIDGRTPILDSDAEVFKEAEST